MHRYSKACRMHQLWGVRSSDTSDLSLVSCIIILVATLKLPGTLFRFFFDEMCAISITFLFIWVLFLLSECACNESGALVRLQVVQASPWRRMSIRSAFVWCKTTSFCSVILLCAPPTECEFMVLFRLFAGVCCIRLCRLRSDHPGNCSSTLGFFFLKSGSFVLSTCIIQSYRCRKANFTIDISLWLRDQLWAQEEVSECLIHPYSFISFL